MKAQTKSIWRIVPLPPTKNACDTYIIPNRNTLILNILIFNFIAVHVCVVGASCSDAPLIYWLRVTADI